jgi:hypothetical protein
MASRIVQLNGSFADRHAATTAITEGLFHLQSGSNYGCYTRRQWWPNIADCDVITVRGKTRVFERMPDEPRDEFSTDGYWSSDYVVVLEKPDTQLFLIPNAVPTYPAEAAMARGCTVIIALMIAFWAPTAVAFLFKQGPWSVVYGCVVLGVVMLTSMYEYRIRTFFAGIKGWWYVYNAIRAGRGTREHYKELVAHLSEADHYTTASVNKQILRWL